MRLLTRPAPEKMATAPRPVLPSESPQVQEAKTETVSKAAEETTERSASAGTSTSPLTSAWLPHEERGSLREEKRLRRRLSPRAQRRLAGTTAILAGLLAFRWIDANQTPTIPLPVTPIFGHQPSMAGPNAEHFYAAAADALQPSSSSIIPETATLGEMQDVVIQNRDSLALVREGFRYQYQGEKTQWMKTSAEPSFSSPFPNFVSQRSIARLLEADARVKASQGDVSGALSASLDAVRFGRDIAQGDHAFIGGMIGSLCDGIGVTEGLTHVEGLSAADARAAARRLEAMGAQEINIPDMLRSEQRMTLNTYQEMFASSHRLPELMGWGSWHGIPASLFYDTLILRYGKQGLVNNYTQAMDEIIRQSTYSYQQRKHIAPPSTAVDMFTASVLPNTQRAFDNTTLRIAQAHILLAELALQAYKQEHNGALPTTLGELTLGPDPYLHSIPTDPYSGDGTDALRYTDGKVHTVGDNGRDDRGAGDDALPTP